MIDNCKIFIGPMSKNVVDAVCKVANKSQNPIGLIPSRRQVEFTGGYVNNWDTYSFSNYVTEKSKNVIIQRDHGGPGQGNEEDDGKDSLEIDTLSSFQLIHIDPWKVSKSLRSAAETTVDLINFCDSIKSDQKYEIGTEEAIRRYTHRELKRFLDIVFSKLGKKSKKIKFGVIQSGTSLMGTKNTGTFSQDRLYRMIKVCNDFDILSKEHNGDYLSLDEIRIRFDTGLSAINIAPEMGRDETKIILDEIRKLGREDLYEKFFKICYKSKKWVKWFDKDFSPKSSKEALLLASGHYVFSSESFQEIKKEISRLDEVAQSYHVKKLENLINATTRGTL